MEKNREIIQPEILSRYPHVLSAISTRNGGVSPEPYGMNLSFRVGDDDENVRKNREVFYGGLGIGLHELAIPDQVHGSAVVCARQAGSYSGTDGLITTASRVFLCVTVADCVPLLMVDPVARAVAAVHAGWRGTVAGIAALAVARLQDECAAVPGRIVAYLGPSAGICCYRVSEDLASRFDGRFVYRDETRVLVDLKMANRHQLIESGVRPENIETSPHCTISEPALFHSYRRDKDRSGRLMAVIGLTA
jgi:YfiH family protein